MINNDIFSRFTMMLSASQVEKLFASKIIVFGVGGVGGAVAEMLVRSGIQHLSVVDFDDVDITNINRQLVANVNNVGKLKVEEFKSKIETISPSARIKIFSEKLTQENIETFKLKDYDYIVDCIDDIKAKKALIKFATSNNIPILSAMGAGNRYKEIPQFEVVDISKTSYDKIAKLLRKFCNEEGIKNLNVLPLSTQNSCVSSESAKGFNPPVLIQSSSCSIHAPNLRRQSTVAEISFE